jgi:methylisocitrate lyase
MPNPWDVGSARALEQMGFKALATTSAGFAWTLGRADNQVRLDEVLEHLRIVADAVMVPVNSDFEGGFAVDPEQVSANVKLAVATGIAGLSIEDSSGDEVDPLFEFDLAVERVRAARRAIDESHRCRSHRTFGIRGWSPDIDRCDCMPKPAPTASIADRHCEQVAAIIAAVC